MRRLFESTETSPRYENWRGHTEHITSEKGEQLLKSRSRILQPHIYETIDPDSMMHMSYYSELSNWPRIMTEVLLNVLLLSQFPERLGSKWLPSSLGEGRGAFPRRLIIFHHQQRAVARAVGNRHGSTRLLACLRSFVAMVESRLSPRLQQLLSNCAVRNGSWSPTRLTRLRNKAAFETRTIRGTKRQCQCVCVGA